MIKEAITTFLLFIFLAITTANASIITDCITEKALFTKTESIKNEDPKTLSLKQQNQPFLY